MFIGWFWSMFVSVDIDLCNNVLSRNNYMIAYNNRTSNCPPPRQTFMPLWLYTILALLHFLIQYQRRQFNYFSSAHLENSIEDLTSKLVWRFIPQLRLEGKLDCKVSLIRISFISVKLCTHHAVKQWSQIAQIISFLETVIRNEGVHISTTYFVGCYLDDKRYVKIKI